MVKVVYSIHHVQSSKTFKIMLIITCIHLLSFFLCGHQNDCVSDKMLVLYMYRYIKLWAFIVKILNVAMGPLYGMPGFCYHARLHPDQ